MSNEGLIAYRGNFDGDKPYYLNKPEYLDIALRYGYDVMVDVWVKSESGQATRDLSEFSFWVGHDAPRYPVSISFLQQPGVWCRATSMVAYDVMHHHGGIHCFFDDPTALHWMTNRGIMIVNLDQWSNTDLINWPVSAEAVAFDPDGGLELLEFPSKYTCSSNVKKLREYITGTEQKELDMTDARKLVNINNPTVGEVSTDPLDGIDVEDAVRWLRENDEVDW